MAGGTATAPLAAAVSNAGAYGGLAGIYGEGAARLRAEIRAVRERTSRPFSVNLWAFVAERAPELVEVCIEEGAPSVTFSFGMPATPIARAKGAGLLVLCQVQTVAGARDAASLGADVIIAQGTEAGGHTGFVSTMALVPQAVDAAGGVPVLAAGGIADGRGLAAALALGAQGVVMGTRFVCAAESTPSAREHRERIVASSADDTLFTGVFDVIDGIRFPEGISGRTIATPFAREWYGREDELRAQREAIMASAEIPGDPPLRAHSAYAGQSAGLIREVKPAAEIVADIVREAEAVLRALPR